MSSLLTNTGLSQMYKADTTVPEMMMMAVTGNIYVKVNQVESY